MARSHRVGVKRTVRSHVGDRESKYRPAMLTPEQLIRAEDIPATLPVPEFLETVEYQLHVGGTTRPDVRIATHRKRTTRQCRAREPLVPREAALCLRRLAVLAFREPPLHYCRTRVVQAPRVWGSVPAIGRSVGREAVRQVLRLVGGIRPATVPRHPRYTLGHVCHGKDGVSRRRIDADGNCFQLLRRRCNFRSHQSPGSLSDGRQVRFVKRGLRVQIPPSAFIVIFCRT